MAQLGVYVGNDPSHLASFEQWLGRPVDGVLVYTAGDTWEDIADPSWAIGMWGPTDRAVYWSVPLIPDDGTTLAQAATGAFNEYYEAAAEKLAASGTEMANGDIFVRTGWEMGGGWFPWGEDGDAEGFKGAFQEFVESFRTASDDFLFAWDYAPGYGDPTAFYPGDDYVDVVAQDFYWNPQWIGSDPAEAFNTLRDMPYGLQWMEDFAEAHGKQTAYPEWGVQGDNAAPFIERAGEWFESHDVVQASYWDKDDVYPGMLSDGSDPSSGAAFVEVFG